MSGCLVRVVCIGARLALISHERHSTLSNVQYNHQDMQRGIEYCHGYERYSPGIHNVIFSGATVHRWEFFTRRLTVHTRGSPHISRQIFFAAAHSREQHAWLFGSGVPRTRRERGGQVLELVSVNAPAGVSLFVVFTSKFALQLYKLKTLVPRPTSRALPLTCQKEKNATKNEKKRKQKKERKRNASSKKDKNEKMKKYQITK